MLVLKRIPPNTKKFISLKASVVLVLFGLIHPEVLGPADPRETKKTPGGVELGMINGEWRILPY